MAILGKNIIENLTVGMYEDNRFIFREYIQNSADQIDKAIKEGILDKNEAIIDIDIDVNNRNIKVYDNATGIKKDKFKSTLSDIANSDKDRNKDKGFRGIGRLGGLAYCDKLIFRSSYQGENTKSIMIWDAKLCKSIIEDPNEKCTAEELINRIIKFEEESYDINEHFFEVEMVNINKQSNELLNVSDIKNYLSFVAPIPFVSSFYIKTEIYKYAQENNFKIDEYCIRINGEQLFKKYKMDLYENKENKEIYDEVSSVHFHKFVNDNNEILAWMWIGISRFEKQIPSTNLSRGIRLRKENIGIGNDKTLARFFKETRGNYYFIGEIYAVHTNLIPNARRDYFNQTNERTELELLMQEKFLELHAMYYAASRIKSAYKSQLKYKEMEKQFNEKKENGGFIDKKEIEDQLQEIDKAKQKSLEGKKEIDKSEKKYNGDGAFSEIFKHIKGKYEEPIKELDNIKEKTVSSVEKKKSFASNIKGYSKKEKKLLGEVFKIISNLLPPNEANELISKIKEELNK